MKNKKSKLILISVFILFFVLSFLCFNNNKNLIKNNANNFNSTNMTDINNGNNANFINQKEKINQNDSNNQTENSGFTSSNLTSSYVVNVGEIWNDTTKRFKRNELLQLIKYASNSTVTINNINAIKNRIVTASTMRGYNSNKDVVVRFGGFDWTATYLSYDKSNNPILTLWLTDSQQLSGKSVYSNNGSPSATPTKTTFNSNGQATWSSAFVTYSDSPNSAYPDNMYGTSYIRSVTLNNGGWYTTSVGGGSGATFTKKSDSVFSPFTNTTSNKTAIADYLVSPLNVSWQEKQSFKTISNFNCDVSNCGWGKDPNNSNYITESEGNYNFSNKDKYDTWKNDLLWLPSVAETGNYAQIRYIGLWDLSDNQNSNPHSNAQYSSWLRSAEDNITYGCSIRYIASNGIYSFNCHDPNFTRPALHINLTEAINSAFDMWGNTQFVSDNLNLLLKYVNGTNTATTNSSLLSSLSSTIGSGAMLSNTIKTNANKVTDKTFLNSNNELLIKFYGLDWYGVFITKDTTTPTPNLILTLFLADSGQLYGKNKISGVTYNKYGSAPFNSGGPPYSNGSTTISNNYGNNYIRTTLLSSTNTASVFYPYLKTSTNKTAIGDFIVSPKDLNTQDALNLQKSQTAKPTLGFRYNLPNESYSNLINYSTPYKNLFLSASTTNYTIWQNDKLWLPSLSEVGLGTNNTISTNSTASNNLRMAGLWGLSTAQRSNTNKTATWLRSGHITDKNLAYTISADGTDYGYATIDTQNAIRPALHLNLTLACQYAS